MSILWLATQNKLGWYVHPRYALFGIVMSLLAVLALIASAAVLGRKHSAPGPYTHEAHGAEPHGAEARLAHHDSGAQRRNGAFALRGKRIRTALKSAQITAVAAAAAVLLVVPPATLTAQSMSHRPDSSELRGVSAGVQDGAPGAAGSGPGGVELGIKELSLLLRQQDSSLLVGRSAAVSGFVVPDADDPDNVFVVTRFAITCCAVDAQPLGVPVLQPGWSKELTEGEWVEASGVFTVNPGATSSWPAVVLPSGVTPIDEPEDPYVS